MSGTSLATLLDEWADKLEVESVLERLVGRGTGPACGSLAAKGKTIVTVVDPDGSGERVKASYGPKADVRVAGNDDVVLPRCDLAIVHGGKPRDWQATFATFGKLANKALIVVVDNPGAWPEQARAFLARVTKPAAAGSVAISSDWGKTSELAPVLWSVGRVRDHVFLEAPSFATGSARLARFASRLAPQHAFVVDVAPRSRQARRRLRLGV